MYRNLKSILPIPRDWQNNEEKRGFFSRIENMFSEIQIMLDKIKRNISNLNGNVETRIVGKCISKSIPSGTTSCRIDFTTGMYFLLISPTGAANQWVGTVYCNSSGGLTVAQINSATGTTVSTGTGYLTASFPNTSGLTLYVTVIPLRNNTIPSFH